MALAIAILLCACGELLESGTDATASKDTGDLREKCYKIVEGACGPVAPAPTPVPTATSTPTPTPTSTPSAIHGWAPAGTMNKSRGEHSATLLADGTVLVAGGNNREGSCDASRCYNAMATAERFNPGTGWTTTGSMSMGRIYHTATLLTDGRVLVVGGGNYSGTTFVATNTAEIFSPSTGSFTRVTNNLPAARAGHNAVLLQNGKVLIVGGISESASSALLFDPGTQTFSSTGSLSTFRSSFTLTLLSSGKVLASGGVSLTNTMVTTAEIYNPSTGTWILTGSPVQPRVSSQALTLSNGKVLTAGGMYKGASSWLDTSSSESYNEATGLWTSTGNLVQRRYAHSMAALPTGEALVAGGVYFGGFGAILTPSVEIYDPAGSGTWRTTTSMSAGRELFTLTALSDGRVLAAGGTDGNLNFLNSTEIFAR
jgi:hypothetical protein